METLPLAREPLPVGKLGNRVIFRHNTHMVIDGKQIADGILKRLAGQLKPARFMAAVLVGDDAGSISFLGQKEKIAKRLGIDFRWYRFPADIKNDDLRDEVGKIARHKTCGGVIVQLPLPKQLNQHYILNVIPPEKDVDVLGERALGAFYTDRSKILPPAVGGLDEILKSLSANGELSVARYTALDECAVAVVGLGLLIGRPIANWIMRRAKETFLLRSTSDLDLLVRADIVIAGVGKAGLITPDRLQPGTLIVDFGYESGKGDFDPSGEATGKTTPESIYYTPTPGGTGPILVAKLYENFYTLNREGGSFEK